MNNYVLLCYKASLIDDRRGSFCDSCLSFYNASTLDDAAKSIYDFIHNDFDPGYKFILFRDFSTLNYLSNFSVETYMYHTIACVDVPLLDSEDSFSIEPKRLEIELFRKVEQIFTAERERRRLAYENQRLNELKEKEKQQDEKDFAEYNRLKQKFENK